MFEILVLAFVIFAIYLVWSYFYFIALYFIIGAILLIFKRNQGHPKTLTEAALYISIWPWYIFW
jgi:hypothetical protein